MERTLKSHTRPQRKQTSCGKIAWLVVVALLILSLGPMRSVAQQERSAWAHPPAGELQLAVGFSAARTNSTAGNFFWMQGGSTEMAAEITKGFAGVASITGWHTGKVSVPQSLIAITFGPRYTDVLHLGKHPWRIFGQALIGEAHAFDGVYPHPVSGPFQQSASMALKVGGGVDVPLNRHICVRVLQADWLRTQLPNGTTNAQNTLLLGAGLVFRFGK